MYLRQGNVFTPVILSIGRGVWQTTHPPTETATAFSFLSLNSVKHLGKLPSPCHQTSFAAGKSEMGLSTPFGAKASQIISAKDAQLIPLSQDQVDRVRDAY